MIFTSSKFLKLLLKGTEVTTEHQKIPKISFKSIKKACFCLQKSLGKSPLQKLEESPFSGLYLLVAMQKEKRK